MRILLSGIFIASSVGKIWHPVRFAENLSNYDLLPAAFISPIAIILPWIELTCGMFVLVNFLLESSVFILGILSTLFGFAVTISLARGLNIECGCFQPSTFISWINPVFDMFLIYIAWQIIQLSSAGPVIEDRTCYPKKIDKASSSKSPAKSYGVPRSRE